ncbi:transcriptional regulator [Microtetraspora sp. NBRC 13810]|uniref:GlxA family transcriptional regulator n=1 Tax=Microtetraspora sp. NBRC 13810 TaxID=3030990 RepID=UPI0024A3FEDF|nr:GlxA family transcriptional regulator [Microtetraspora sp. NBRC 13810]GLW07053.1 transcriptional regulator [Microtetraspora sp. NBRC 13810]
MTTRHVVFAVFPDFQILDLTGPYEVFSQVGMHAGGVVIQTVAADPGPVRARCGLSVSPVMTMEEATGPIDTLIVVGGVGVRRACEDARLVGWIRQAAGRARRTASVCSGAFLLAAAGLLDGRRAVTHWGRCESLAREYPLVDVDPDPIYVRDGDIWTSAGVTAGIDLALAMAEEDHGAEMSRAIARQLVMFVQRPGGQAQFSAQLAAQRPSRAPLRGVQDWIADHLDTDLTVSALAARAGMSERHFARVFRAETGRTPAAYVETARVEAARRLLETTGTTVEAVARACGFGTVETLHRSFKRTVRVTPGEYRERFSAAT